MRDPTPTRPGRGLGTGWKVRAGFTLVETLLVIALLVAITAISIPIMVSFAEASAFRSLGDQVRASGLFARAEAERSGRAVELRLERRGGAWVVVSAGLEGATVSGASREDGEGDGARGARADDAALAGRGGDVLVEFPARWSVASRIRVEVARGARAADARDSGGDADDAATEPAVMEESSAFDPDADESGQEGGGGDLDWDLVLVGAADAIGGGAGGVGGDDGAGVGGGAGSGDVLLAIYWPGGTVVVGPREVRVGDGRGRRASVRVNSWSGELVVEEIAAAAEGTDRKEKAAAEDPRDGADGAEGAERGTRAVPGPGEESLNAAGETGGGATERPRTPTDAEKEGAGDGEKGAPKETEKDEKQEDDRRGSP